MLLLLLLSFLAVSLVQAVCPCGRNRGGISCAACRLNGTIRLSLDRSTADCLSITPIEITDICRLTLPDGDIIPGALVCSAEKCPLTPIESEIVRKADCKCSRLSPISFKFGLGASGSPCQSFVRTATADGECSRGALAYCVYPEIADMIGGLNPSSVYSVSGWRAGGDPHCRLYASSHVSLPGRSDSNPAVPAARRDAR